MTEQRRSCPDCDTSMEPIKLIDATFRGLDWEGRQQVELKYAAPDARRGFFTSSIEPLGTVKAQICPACGRIVLHGQPVQKDS